MHTFKLGRVNFNLILLKSNLKSEFLIIINNFETIPIVKDESTVLSPPGFSELKHKKKRLNSEFSSQYTILIIYLL